MDQQLVNTVRSSTAFRPLKELYGRTLAGTFGPLALKTVRERMVELNWCRNVVNKQVHRIKRLFKWGVENEVVPASVYHALQAVAGLRLGRSQARETRPVRPVPEILIDAVQPFVSPQVWAMIQLQLVAGMRPGEVCLMRACDFEMTSRVWVYRPPDHKNAFRAQPREIYLGPKAQEVVRPWLKLDTQAYLFSPAEAEVARNRKRRAGRKSPMTPSQAARRPKSNRRRPWRDRYNRQSYRVAIQRACDRAFPLPDHLRPRRSVEGQLESRKTWMARLTQEEKTEIMAWRSEHRWHPHQLRHNAATYLRRGFGIELTRIILGHKTAFTTEIYAEADRQQAIEVMARIG